MARPPVTPLLLTAWPYEEADLRQHSGYPPRRRYRWRHEWAILAAQFFLSDRWGPRPKSSLKNCTARCVLRGAHTRHPSVEPGGVRAVFQVIHGREREIRPSSYDFCGVLSRFEHDCR